MFAAGFKDPYIGFLEADRPWVLEADRPWVSEDPYVEFLEADLSDPQVQI